MAFLAAWLSAGENLATKQEHWSMEAFQSTRAERVLLRQQMEATGSGRILLACERPLVEGEDVEPANIDVYLPPASRWA